MDGHRVGKLSKTGCTTKNSAFLYKSRQKLQSYSDLFTFTAMNFISTQPQLNMNYYGMSRPMSRIQSCTGRADGSENVTTATSFISSSDQLQIVQRNYNFITGASSGLLLIAQVRNCDLFHSFSVFFFKLIRLKLFKQATSTGYYAANMQRPYQRSFMGH
jgi:hypothetical protein